MDIPTLHVVHLVLLSLYAILTIVNCQLYIGMPGVRWFAIFNVCTLISTLLLGIRGNQANAIQLVLGSWLGVIAYIFLFFCVADYFRKSFVRRSIWIAFAPVTLMVFIQYGVIHPVLSTRLEFYSLFLAFEQSITAVFIHHCATGRVRTAAHLLALMLSALCLLNLTQLVVVAFRSGSDPYLAAAPLSGWTILLNFILQGGVMMAFVWLTSASLRQELEIQASTDSLTGLLNRRAIETAAQQHIADSRRTLQPVAAILIDLDRFKQLNDSLGHQCGDSVLIAVSGALRAGLRKRDLLARLGGDEFVVLLIDTNLNAAAEMAERLRLSLERLEIKHKSSPLGVSASFGVGQIDGVNDWEALLSKCDMALYEVKRAGGNLVAPHIQYS